MTFYTRCKKLQIPNFKLFWSPVTNPQQINLEGPKKRPVRDGKARLRPTEKILNFLSPPYPKNTLMDQLKFCTVIRG